MRERLAEFNERLGRRREAATLSEPVSYPELARFFLWRGVYALAGPLVVLLPTQVFLSGITGTILLGCGLFAVLLAGAAGSVYALGRPVHAAAFGTLTASLLAVQSLWSTTDPAFSTGFVVGMSVFLGFVSVLVGLVASDEVRRELAATE